MIINIFVESYKLYKMFVKKFVKCFTTLKKVDPQNHTLSVNCVQLPTRKLTVDGEKEINCQRRNENEYVYNLT